MPRLWLALALLLALHGAATAAPPLDARDLGAAADEDPTEPLFLAFAPRDEAGLDALLGSPAPRRWLTAEEFGDRFGAPQADYEAAARWLRRRGFGHVRTWPGRLGIAFDGTAGQVARAFGRRLRRFGWEGRIRTAAAGEPVLPAFGGTRPAALLGLDGFVRVHPTTRIGGTNVLAPGDVYTTYGVGAVHGDGFRGRNVTLVVLALSDFDQGDVSLFRSMFGLAPATVVKRFVGASPGKGDPVALGEVLLDTEWSGALAPEATLVAEIAASDNAGGFAAAVSDVLNANVADVLSVSLGICEPVLGGPLTQQLGNMWRQAAAQGTSVVVSAGDDGVTDCRRQPAPGVDALAPAVNAVASSPNVTAVGGTVVDPLFDVDGAATGYGGEVVWDDAANDPNGGAGGGGRSTFFAKPPYQDQNGLPPDGARDLPDVAFAASPRSPGFALVTGGTVVGVGGTSVSAPAWAGFAALLVQKRGARLGLLNGELYELGLEQAQNLRAPVFHDVTSGSNDVQGVAGFAAGPGYDLATGWGSFDAPALFAAFDPGPACSSDGDCDDANGCTSDVCSPGGCRHAAIADGTDCRTLDCGPGVCQAAICAATGAGSCDDADPCTDDVCAGAGTCSHPAALGADAVTCVFAGGDVTAAACDGQRVPAALGRLVARARKLVGKTSAPGKRSARLVRRARQRLGHAARVMRRAARRLSPDCTASLTTQLDSARDQAAHLRALLVS